MELNRIELDVLFLEEIMIVRGVWVVLYMGSFLIDFVILCVGFLEMFGEVKIMCIWGFWYFFDFLVMVKLDGILYVLN